MVTSKSDLKIAAEYNGTIYSDPHQPFRKGNEKPPNSESEKSESVSRTLRTFVETTSLKGVPKIFKSKTKIQRGLWAICLLIGLSIGLWQISLLFLQYVSYSTVITVEEIRDEAPIFPDISICNINPTSSNLSTPWTFDNFLYYVVAEVIPEVYTNTSNLWPSNDIEYYLYWDILSAEGYFQNMPTSQDAGLARYRHTLINKCLWSPWDFESSTGDIRCYDDLQRSSIKYFFSSQYGPCFTIRTTSEEQASKMEKFSSFIYLQDIGGVDIYGIKLTTDWSYSAGIKVIP